MNRIEHAATIAILALPFSMAARAQCPLQELHAPSPADLEFFGRALSSDTLLASASDDDDAGPNVGAVYVFDRDGGTWSESAKLRPQSSGTIRKLGWSVDLDGELAAVSNLGFSTSLGGARLYRRLGGEWYPMSILGEQEHVGSEVALGDGEVMVGTDEGPAGPDSGTVYVYDTAARATGYCQTTPNSVGEGARIHSYGSGSIECGEFTLLAEGAPPGQYGKFFYGPEVARTPFGNGLLCVGSGSLGLFRLLPPMTSDEHGVYLRIVDFTAPPAGSGPGQVSPGSTWYFQYWYRDPAAGGQRFNLSGGLCVTFAP